MALNAAKGLLWRVGFAIRETGQALERAGCRLQGIYSYEEELSRHMPVAPLRYNAPKLGKHVFVAPSSLVAGDVKVGDSSSIWYNAIVKGDRESVTIGDNVNIQDSAYVGTTMEFSPAVTIGDNVSVGHGAVLKGCTVGSNSLIGIGAVVSEGAQIGKYVILGAGSYVEEDTVIPDGELWVGHPAVKKRNLKDSEIQYLKDLPQRYVELSEEHAEIIDLLRHKQSDYSGVYHASH